MNMTLEDVKANFSGKSRTGAVRPSCDELLDAKPSGLPLLEYHRYKFPQSTIIIP